MRWARRWGHWFKNPGEQRSRKETRWGSEDNPTVRIPVINKRGKITPCWECGRQYTCSMYESLTRHRLKSPGRDHGTNVLHYCDIFTKDKIK